jgi:hypothetical protein
MASRFFFVVLVICLAVIYLLLASPLVFAQASSQTATVVSVRSIRHMDGPFPSRFPHPIYFTIDFAFRTSAGSYCTGYETPVLDEVQELTASQGKEVRVEIRGKKFIVTLPTGRKIKAELEKPTQC